MPSGFSGACGEQAVAPARCVPRIDVGAERERLAAARQQEACAWRRCRRSSARSRPGPPGGTRIPCSLRRPSVLAAVLQLGVAGREDHVRQAFAERVRSACRRGPVRPASCASGGAASASPSATPPSSSGASEALTCSIHGSVAATVALASALTPGNDVVGEASCAGGKAALQRGEARVDVAAACSAARRRSREAAGLRRRSARKKVLKLAISSPSCLLVDVQRGGHLADAGDQLREVVRLGAADAPG